MKFATALTFGTLILNAGELDGPSDTALVAHEWGTFTSVAADDGHALPWAPLFGAPDLPCFVDRGNPALSKWQISGLVRMETPVLYFYSQRPVTLSVHVAFPQGIITEYYPRASKIAMASTMTGPIYRNGSIEWNDVGVLPGANLQFRSTAGASRYYAARETDAAPLRIGHEQEKFLFYRGVGSFRPPLLAHYGTGGKLEIGNSGPEPIPLAILFENRGGKIGYQAVRNIQGGVTLDKPALTGDFDQLRRDLTTDLTEFGLYVKEAAAMVETWRDSWFEEGTRILYIMPSHEVDSILPLTINPAPERATRVFVGRVEVLSPSTRQVLQDANERGDFVALAKFGRFLDVFARQRKLRGPAVQTAFLTLAQTEGGGCIH
jgi:hypothetical protein